MRNIFSEYLKNAPKMSKINYWDLPQSTCLELNSIPKNIKLRGKSLTVKKLLSNFGKNHKINKKISAIFFYRGIRKLPLKFPFSLDNINFVELYSLMASEGSNNTEFRLHVPEDFFHDMFINNLESLFSKNILTYLHQKQEKGFLRSTAPAIIRYFIPIQDHIPKIILLNKDYSKRYLQIAFESEGSPIHVGSKRYISLKRNIDITKIVENKLKYPEEKRIYAKQLEKDYPDLIKKILDNPPKLILGEHLLLKEYFKIDSNLNLECIRINKTSSGFGKITSRWALYIYADSINRFIDEINFIGAKKKALTQKMRMVIGNRKQYFSFELMKKISKKSLINSSDFVREMKKLGYVSPRAYISRYLKKGILKKTGRGKYLIVN